MNYREKMRKAIECPQFGNIDYGEWGTLRLDQRKNIKRLLDEMDSADEVIKNQFFEINRLNNIIKEVRKYIEKHKETRAIYDPYGTPSGIPNRYEYYVEGYYELLEILDKENK